MSSTIIPTIPTDPSILPPTGQSAFLGQPPATQRDYYVIKGLFRMIGVININPMLGFFAAKRPADYKYETRVPGVLTGLIIVILVIVLPTAARLGLRLRRVSNMVFGWDDWIIILAALLALVYPITQIISIAKGTAGHHAWEVTYEQYDFGMIVATVCRSSFYVAVGLIKLSIAIFIRRLADRIGRKWYVLIDVFIGTIVAYIFLSLFYTVLICRPFAIQWDMELRGRLEPMPTCGDTALQAKILSGMHVAQGLILLCTPIIILWKVRMHTPKKIRLFIIWATGGVTVLGGLLRQLRPTLTNDFTWDYVEVLVWTCLDLSLGMLTASLPVLDGLFEEYWRKAKSTVANSYGRNHSRTNASWQYSKASDKGTSSNRRSTIITAGVSQNKEHSESSERIVGAGERGRNLDQGAEMGILKSQDIEVRVSENHGQQQYRPSWEEPGNRP